MHPDVHFVFPIYKNEKKKKRLCDDYIDEWRKCLSENQYLSLEQWLSYIDAENSQVSIYADESREIIRKISLKTYESDYKIMIIWLPELMNPVCANKLLKILEEPYEKTVFCWSAINPIKYWVLYSPVHNALICGSFHPKKYRKPCKGDTP